MTIAHLSLRLRRNFDKIRQKMEIMFVYLSYMFGLLTFIKKRNTTKIMLHPSLSFTLDITFLSHLFPMPCGAGSTVPRVCCGCDTSYIVSVHIQCQASIYTLSLCRGHRWLVRLAKQETLTAPGHLVSPLVCRGP